MESNFESVSLCTRQDVHRDDQTRINWTRDHWELVCHVHATLASYKLQLHVHADGRWKLISDPKR